MYGWVQKYMNYQRFFIKGTGVFVLLNLFSKLSACTGPSSGSCQRFFNKINLNIYNQPFHINGWSKFNLNGIAFHRGGAPEYILADVRLLAEVFLVGLNG